jgi:hypothetical protein
MSPIAQADQAELRRVELLRIAQSKSFARAGKLRQLVTWLGERAISGPETKPSEYLVGVEALGKPNDFDPSFDVSVRQLKRRMCARLSEYYSSEGNSSNLRLVCERGFAVRFDWIASPAPGQPCVAVLPLHGDDGGVIMGSLSHVLMESAGARVLSRSAVLEASPRHLAEHHGVSHFVEGELLRQHDHSWELALRLLDASHGFILSGVRVTGSGPISSANLTGAALTFRKLLHNS